METPLSAPERRTRILALLTQQGRVRVSDLSQLLHISEVTIRSDLGEMEAQGLLSRTHGGAVPSSRGYYHLSLRERMQTRAPEKRAIARACAQLIEDGDTLLVNAGTTTLMAMEALRSRRNLTVVTNSLPVAQQAGEISQSTVILLGGWIHAAYQFTYGDDALRQLRLYRADKALIAMDGVRPDEGLTTYHAMEAEVDRLMIERAGATLVLADHSKVGAASFSTVAPIDRVDCLVTDDGAPAAMVDALRELNVEVVLAPVE